MRIVRYPLLISVLCLFLVACGGGEAESENADISVFLANAESFRDQGQYQSAVIEARNAVQAAPDNPGGHISLAKSMMAIGQGREAVRVLESISADTPEYQVVLADAYFRSAKFRSARETLGDKDFGEFQPRANLIRARILLQRGDREAARTAFEALKEGGVVVTDASLGLAGIAATEQDFATAMKELDAVLAADPDNPEALLFKSGVKSAQGDLVGAEEELMAAVSALPSTDIMTPLRYSVLVALRDNLTSQGKSNEALIYSGLIAESTPGAQELNDKLEAATVAISESDFARAREILADVRETAPNSERAATMLGLIEYLEGDNSGAVAQFEQFVDPETASPIALQVMAMAELRLNQPEKVVETLRKDIDDSQDGKLVAMYAIALISSGEPEEGEKYLVKALDLDPDNGRLRLPLARLYNTLGRRDEALEQARLGFKSSPADPVVQSAFVEQLMGLEKADEAASVVKGLTSSYPDSQPTQLIVAGFHMIQNNFEPARAALNRALELGESRPARYQLARIAFAEEDYAGAKETFEKLIELEPNDSQAYKALFTVYEASGDTDKALPVLQEYVARGESDAPVFVLSEYFGRTGEYDKAYELIKDVNFEESAEASALRLTLMLSEGSSLIQARDYESARTVLVDALTEYDDEPRLLASLITVEMASDNLPEARAVYTRLAELIPDAPITSILAGDIANRERDYRKARVHYMDAWEKVPSDQVAVKAYSMMRQLEDRAAPAHMEFLDDWREKLPNSLMGAVTTAGHLMEVGKTKEARAEYERIVSLNPNVAVAYNNLAWLYGPDEMKQAMEAGKKAYELAPNSAEIADTYGWFLYKNGDRTKAEEILKIAYDLAPDNEEIKAHYEEVKGG